MLSEAKMQSTGQGGPEVNRDIEVLFGRLNDLVRANNALQKTVDSLSGGSAGSPSNPGTEDPPSGGGDAMVYPTTEATATVLAGTGETEDTEDAWTTVASGAPAGSRFALVYSRMWSTSDDAGGQISLRKSSGDQEITVAVVRFNGTSDADREPVCPWFPVELTAGGDFDYKADSTNGSVEWYVSRIGYW